MNARQRRNAARAKTLRSSDPSRPMLRTQYAKGVMPGTYSGRLKWSEGMAAMTPDDNHR